MSERNEFLDDSWNPVPVETKQPMSADAQTTAEWLRNTAENFDELWADDSFRMDFTDALAEAGAEVKALAARNGELAAALVDIAEGEKTSYLACPGPPNCDRSHYPTCPVSIARAALSGQPVGTKVERVREPDKELRARLCTGCADGLPFIAPGVHYVTPDITSRCAALSGEAGDPEAERVRERARERRES